MLTFQLIGSVGCGSDKDSNTAVTDASSTEVAKVTEEPATEAAPVETEDTKTVVPESTEAVKEMDSSDDKKNTGKDNESDNKAICSSYDELLEKGYEQNKTTTHKYAKKDEHTLLNRLKKYRDNHLLFLKDSNVKFHNNASESLLRKCKSHQKMTGGFRKESGGELYCNIMSIIETCKIKNMSVFDSIMEIFTGNRAIY